MEMTMQPIRATTPAGLVAVNETIHDYWFDIAEVKHDAIAGTLTIPFRRPVLEDQPKGASPQSTHTDWCLIIAHVQRVRVEDQQQIGRYDFNEVRFFPQSRCVSIATNIPTELIAEVTKLDVEVREASAETGSR
jgi:hypothetical protein